MEKIRFQKNSDEMMRVISEQKKSLYLKAYVGSVYKDGVWRKTPYKDGVWRKTPEGQDPLQWFLTTSRTGNQMLYVSAAVEAFRAHGIPARYVEGYYLGVSKIQDSKNGEVSITGENAHAWVEVYFDGVGWKAVDVTPGYYYNVATLQKMVNTPEQIKKNAAMILLGAVTVLVIAGFILFVILEIRLWLLEQTLKKQYEQADMDQKIRILQMQIFGLLGIFGIETKFGWKTKEKLKLRYQFQKYCM